jgi:hypothetical protein
MESKAYSLMEQDLEYFHKAMDAKTEAIFIDNEYEERNESTSMSPWQQYVYINEIIGALDKSIKYQNLLTVTKMHYNFIIKANQADHYLTTKAEEGYDYIISYNSYVDYINLRWPVVLEKNSNQYYGNILYSSLQVRNDPNHPTNPLYNDNEIFFEFNQSKGIVSVTEFFLFQPVFEVQEDIAELLSEADSLEIQASRIALGVSLTTVAVVLSGAMANRIDGRKMEQEFAKLREKEGRIPKEKHDLISIPVLIIAAIISMLGIAFPIFFS